MDNLTSTLDGVLQELDSIDQHREEVIALTRKLNRVSGRGIAFIVRGENPIDLLEEAKSIYQQLHTTLEEVVAVTSWRICNSGVEEYGEFAILSSLNNSQTIPTPSDLDLPSWIWLSSLGDVVGELRRIILNHLLQGSAQMAFNLLKSMQTIYTEISGLDMSKSIVSNLRKKVDVARISIERTESDVLNFQLSRGLK